MPLIKFYKIFCVDNPSLCYVGQTTRNLSRRFNEHKSRSGAKKQYSSAELFRKGPCKIELITEKLIDSEFEAKLYEIELIIEHCAINAHKKGGIIAVDDRKNKSKGPSEGLMAFAKYYFTEDNFPKPSKVSNTEIINEYEEFKKRNGVDDALTKSRMTQFLHNYLQLPRYRNSKSRGIFIDDINAIRSKF